MAESANSFLCILAIGLMSYLCLLAVGLYPIQRIKPCDDGPCMGGQYYDSARNECLSCELGEYMGEAEHKCEQCYRCTVPDNRNHEIALKSCTSTSDAEIGCVEGYFRDNRDRTCELCTVCNENEVEKTECGLYHDRECQIITTPKTTPETTMTSKETTTTTTMTTTTAGKPPEKDTTTTSNANNGDDTATIVGSVVGPLVFLGLIILGVCLYLYCRRFQKQTESNVKSEEIIPMTDRTDLTNS